MAKQSASLSRSAVVRIRTSGSTEGLLHLKDSTKLLGENLVGLHKIQLGISFISSMTSCTNVNR